MFPHRIVKNGPFQLIMILKLVMMLTFMTMTKLMTTKVWLGCKIIGDKIGSRKQKCCCNYPGNDSPNEGWERVRSGGRIS